MSILELCLRLQANVGPRPRRSLACVWRGIEKAATFKQIRRCVDTGDVPLTVEAGRIQPLNGHGSMLLHPLIDNERFLHLARFCSYIPLHDITSPARIAAIYVLARLFPRRWHALYMRSFGEAVDQRIAGTVDRFNVTLAEPSDYELIEIASLFVDYQRPASKEARQQSAAPMKPFFDALKPLACAAFALLPTTSAATYQLSSFLVVAHAALNRDAHRRVVRFLERYETCTRRQLRALESAWLSAAPTLPSDEFVCDILSQFKYV